MIFLLKNILEDRSVVQLPDAKGSFNLLLNQSA